MAIVNKSALLEYSAEQMFALVEDVEQYPDFLPWCGGASIKQSNGNGEVVAELTVELGGLRKSFTTRNHNAPSESITMTLVNGPFNRLDGRWTFKALRPDACKVELNLEYDLSGHVLEALLNQVFGAITGSMVEAFCKRAHEVYGK